MARLDLLHQAVRTALENEGWNITHDPLPVKIGENLMKLIWALRKLLRSKGRRKNCS